MKKLSPQVYACTPGSRLSFAPLFEDVFDLDIEVMPKRCFKPFELVATITGAAAWMNHARADAIRVEHVPDASLRNWAASPVVRPDGSQISSELRLRPSRRNHALVFRRQEQFDKQAEALSAHAGLIVLFRQLHRCRTHTFGPGAPGKVGNREHQFPILSQAIVEPLRHRGICGSQSFCVVEGEPREFASLHEKLIVICVFELLDGLSSGASAACRNGLIAPLSLAARSSTRQLHR